MDISSIPPDLASNDVGVGEKPMEELQAINRIADTWLNLVKTCDTQYN